MRRAALFSAFAIAASVVPVVAGTVPTAHAAVDVSVVLDGHGNGHGIGMGQWGAYGYAVDLGWTSAQILDHYYGGTVAGTVALDTPVAIRLQNLDGQQTAVSVDTGQLVVNDVASGAWRSVLVRETAPSTYSVWARTDVVRCPSAVGDPVGAGWTLLNASVANTVNVRTAVDSTTVTDLHQLAAVCEPSGTVRWYRGTIRALNDSAGNNRTVSVLPMEQYLRSVIAMEMSPGWATAGAGRGAQALQVQAVAARSYALAAQSYPYANTCDLSCQSYPGVAFQASGAALRQVEAASTDAAVVATAGVVRRIGTTAGPIALTMYSASNGGYSAANNNALTPFPPVPDAGDATTLNPSHNWSVTLLGSAISAKYPAIGTFVGLSVLSRNGFGEWGGRVLSLSVTGTAGSVTVTGAAFRTAMGLRDTWFNVRGSGGPVDCQGRVEPPVTGTMPAPVAAQFTPLVPRRMIDTRNGTGTALLPLTGGCTMVVDPGVDPSVTAVAVNLTSVNSTGNTYITAYPCGVARPVVSAVQAVPGRPVAGMAVVPLAADGTFCVFSKGTTDLVIDLFGTYAAGAGVNFEPTLPTRLMDTRPFVTPLAAGTVLHVKVAGTTVVPGTATAAALTVQALGVTQASFVTVYPCTATRPQVSSLNAAAGVAVTNHVQVQLSSAGEVCVYISGPMHIVVDVSGWFGPGATTQYYAVTPVRAVDTRSNIGLVGAFTAGANRAVTLAGTNGLPPAGQLRAVMAEVTAVNATATGYLTVHPCMTPVPEVSMVRFVQYVNAATSVAGMDDASGRWCIFASTAVHVLVDVNGYFA